MGPWTVGGAKTDETTERPPNKGLRNAARPFYSSQIEWNRITLSMYYLKLREGLISLQGSKAVSHCKLSLLGYVGGCWATEYDLV